jgi:hypothetical protein
LGDPLKARRRRNAQWLRSRRGRGCRCDDQSRGAETQERGRQPKA